jgi:Cu/Ag efflux protein CusF
MLGSRQLNHVKMLRYLILLLVGWAFTNLAQAENNGVKDAHCPLQAMSMETIGDTPSAPVEATVRRVMPEEKRIVLDHGAIKNLNMKTIGEMAPMTMMPFKVDDPNLLRNVKTDDKITFRTLYRCGALTITSLHIQKD